MLEPSACTCPHGIQHLGGPTEETLRLLLGISNICAAAMKPIPKFEKHRDRKIRGGGWSDAAQLACEADHYTYAPGVRCDHVGFRLCRVVR